MTLFRSCLAFDARALRPLVYQIVRIKFQYVRIFSHPLIYQMGLSIFDLASPSYAGYLRQYQYGRKAKAIPNRTQAGFAYQFV